MTEQRYAILIGSSCFHDDSGLQNLQCPEADVDGIHEILVAAEHGNFTDVVVCKNQPYHEVASTINAVFKNTRRNDLVLLYYSGHGCIDIEGQLYLATADTEKSSLPVSSLRFELIRFIIRNHPSVTKVAIILDCCYSGAAEKAFLRGDAVDAQLQRVAESCGIYILTASTSTQAAQEKEGDKYGVLTKHIINGILSGEAAGPDGLVTMDTLFRYVSENVRQDGPQEPMKWELGVKGSEIVIARTKFSSTDEWSGLVGKRLHEIRDQIPPSIYNQAQQLAQASLDSLPPEQRGFGELLDNLVTKRVTTGVFIEQWYEAQAGNPIREQASEVVTAQEIDTTESTKSESQQALSQTHFSLDTELSTGEDTLPPPLEATFSLLSSQIKTFSTELSREKATRLEEIREIYREGKHREAYDQMKEFLNNPSWNLLEKPLQALALRVYAVMMMRLDGSSGLARARDLIQESEGINPAEDITSTLALLRYYEAGAEAAIEEVDHPSTLDAFNTRLALQVETNMVKEALASLRNPPENLAFNADTRRLYALALLAEGDLQGAREQIEEAKHERPRWQSVRIAAAMIDYYSALSPVALPSYLVSYPIAIPPSLVKRDDVSQSLLRKAAEEFRVLASEFGDNDVERMTFQAWQLACLANITEGHESAAHLCEELLLKDPSNPPALSWAISRNLEVDLSASERALEEKLSEEETHGQ